MSQANFRVTAAMLAGVEPWHATRREGFIMAVLRGLGEMPGRAAIYASAWARSQSKEPWVQTCY